MLKFRFVMCNTYVEPYGTCMTCITPLLLLNKKKIFLIKKKKKKIFNKQNK